jgi:2-polyprenyl-3-methyl-5-hydroxy-6-metoxy-1,4-benzoquinol methylase
MIIHKLIAQHLKHKDDAGFYLLQAEDAIAWIEKSGAKIGPGVRALDLGCGHGIFGAALARKGCTVTFSDEKNFLSPDLGAADFRPLDLEKENISKLGQFDLVICSNVLEHLSDPQRLLEMIPQALTPGGSFYLSWTNWLSPWGGHEFSPYHYFGASRGHLVFDRIKKRPRIHTPSVNLFPTSIGDILSRLRKIEGVRIIAAAPRYYPEFWWLLRMPLLREFLTWNCALLIQKEK